MYLLYKLYNQRALSVLDSLLASKGSYTNLACKYSVAAVTRARR